MKRVVVVSLAVAAAAVVVPATQASAAVKYVNYKNCTAMNKVYPHGVGRSGAHDHTSSGKPVTNFYRNTKLYNINKSHDRDKDGIACEEA